VREVKTSEIVRNIQNCGGRWTCLVMKIQSLNGVVRSGGVGGGDGGGNGTEVYDDETLSC
jgi:hypothetical protein